ncbi:citrate transporter family protein [[Clostridium] bifermentans ATCC 638]|uniref:Citrate transporter family protein n=1 Tax=Paraclostridium bifermentans ATCC 638 = DSM 14991 TaxID=1233171 RepID=T4VLC6_PARBF|nr:SLC13 family permease [Paraclostridium bifermentans]EQK42293.1 citrate transporter family protein [[Clostridium] bifermentans ATCC 638] [Paraclostridium bifermentans ATCC 638 = DSM 14991]RIZ59827.1 anion transporter [Paraclostridium bifermentans]UAG19146.1 anion permease [Paraclostridium bifermentans]
MLNNNNQELSIPIIDNHNSNKNNLKNFIKKEIVLILSVSLAIITSFISSPKLSYIDFKVLILLFNLMVVVVAFKELKVLDSIAISLLRKCSTYTSISFALVFITFLASMVVTNDVALITFVPLSIVVAKKSDINVLKIVILQTLAANLGSSFTPMGNPQNLFIYSFYNLDPSDFFKITAPLVILSVLFLSVIILKSKKIKLDLYLEDVEIENKGYVILFSILFAIILLSVFHIVDYRLAFIITLLTVLILNKRLLKQIDYSLLLTFIGFFIFIGNISTMDYIRSFMMSLLNSPQSTFITSILSSQVISNVPATMLLSGFTNNFKELLLGVNIGGMGTLIASLASVISYKIYTNEFKDDSSTYLKCFTFYNVLGLIVAIPIVYLILFI